MGFSNSNWMEDRGGWDYHGCRDVEERAVDGTWWVRVPVTVLEVACPGGRRVAVNIILVDWDGGGEWRQAPPFKALGWNLIILIVFSRKRRSGLVAFKRPTDLCGWSRR